MSFDERRKIEQRLAALPEPDLTDPDNPEWTQATFARAQRVEDLAPELRDTLLAAFPNTKRLGRPPKAAPKRGVYLRLDPEVVDHFKIGGAGWQTRLNAALRNIVHNDQAKD